MKLGYVTLRAKDLKTMVTFYTEIIGLSILKESEKEVELGVKDEKIIVLHADETLTLPLKPYAGLYHLAILVPDEAILGSILYHFNDKGYSIDGAGDHDYSQALYMHDPEGNGIEIYADRPREQWTIYEDGTIKSITEAVDIERLLVLGKDYLFVGMPEGTRLGHVHLQVGSIQQAREFYVDTLGYEIKTDMGHAIFISKNGYHHDFGINVWSGNVEALPYNMTGLESVTLYVQKLPIMKTNVIEKDENHMIIHDNNGITLHLNVL